MMNKFKTAAAAAALMALPFAASAAPYVEAADLSADMAYSFSADLLGGDGSATFNFTALDDFFIDGFSLTGSGTNGGVDIGNTTYEITKPNTGPSTFGVILAGGTVGFGGDIVAGVTSYTAGDTFSVIFSTDPVNVKPVSYTVSFDTQAVAAVPVPAAGLLLLSAVGGAAALRRRKKA